MVYRNANQQRILRKIEYRMKLEEARKSVDESTYSAFASAMSRYIDSVLEPLLDSQVLIEIAEADHEWDQRRIGEESNAEALRLKGIKRAIYSDLGDGVQLDLNRISQRAGKKVTEAQESSGNSRLPNIENYWESMSETERSQAMRELKYLEKKDPEKYNACMMIYVSEIRKNQDILEDFLKVFGRTYAAATSPIHHLQPPTEKSARLMEYWNRLERKRNAYSKALQIARDAIEYLNQEMYTVMVSNAARENSMTESDKQEVEIDKQEFMRLAEEDGLGDFASCLAPPRLIGEVVQDEQDTIDEIMREFSGEPSARAIAAPLDSDLKGSGNKTKGRQIEG